MSRTDAAPSADLPTRPLRGGVAGNMAMLCCLELEEFEELEVFTKAFATFSIHFLPAMDVCYSTQKPGCGSGACTFVCGLGIPVKWAACGWKDIMN